MPRKPKPAAKMPAGPGRTRTSILVQLHCKIHPDTLKLLEQLARDHFNGNKTAAVEAAIEGLAGKVPSDLELAETLVDRISARNLRDALRHGRTIGGVLTIEPPSTGSPR